MTDADAKRDYLINRAFALIEILQASYDRINKSLNTFNSSLGSLIQLNSQSNSDNTDRITVLESTVLGLSGGTPFWYKILNTVPGTAAASINCLVYSGIRYESNLGMTLDHTLFTNNTGQSITLYIQYSLAVDVPVGAGTIQIETYIMQTFFVPFTGPIKYNLYSNSSSMTNASIFGGVYRSFKSGIVVVPNTEGVNLIFTIAGDTGAIGCTWKDYSWMAMSKLS